ncbi:uncharacterized protein [Branchiostoma lanceolatum]|uniref:uncharacterized protein n=1 Tax=Branchiostoma lanceolatum TaxID=7740 RepID=UPI0034546266
MDEDEVTTHVGSASDQGAASQEGEDDPRTRLKKHLQLLRSRLSASPDDIEQFAHLNISELTEVPHPDFSGIKHSAGDDLSSGQGMTRGFGEEEPSKTTQGVAPKEVGETLEGRGQQPSEEENKNRSANDAVKDTSEEAELRDKSEDRPCPYKVIWQRKGGEVNPPPPYQPPTEAFGEELVEVKISATSDNNKEIYVLSDIHLGRPLAICPGHSQLESALSRIMAAAAEGKVHSLILLGDIFEMWVQEAAEPAWTDQDFLRHWKTDALCKAFTKSVCKMAEEYGVAVYYVWGNHDHEITPAMVHELFSGKVRFIPGVLIYSISVAHREYRVRFEHGHIWDLMSTYSYAESHGLVCGRPFGYYICRCASYRILNGQLAGDALDESIQTAKAQFHAMLKSAGPGIMSLMCLPDIREELLSLLLELALGGSIHGNGVVRMHDGMYVPVQRLPQNSFIERLCKQEGVEKVLKMFLVYLGDSSPLLEACAEDVVVLGHDHHWAAKTAKGRDGRTILFANSGAWVDAEEVSYLRMVPPTSLEDGSIEVLHYPITMATDEEDRK